MTPTAQFNITRLELAKEFAKEIIRHHGLTQCQEIQRPEHITEMAVLLADDLMKRLGEGEG